MNKFNVDYMNIVNSIFDLDSLYKMYNESSIKYAAIVGNKDIINTIADDMMINKFKGVNVFPIYHMSPDDLGETINTSIAIRGVYIDIDEILNEFSYSDSISKIAYQVKIISSAGMPTYIGLRLDNKILIDDLCESLPSNANVIWYFKDNFTDDIYKWITNYIKDIELKGGVMPFIIVNIRNINFINDKYNDLLPLICPSTISVDNLDISSIKLEQYMGTALLGILMDKVQY